MDETKPNPVTLIIMGVCGCGKTAVGRRLARELRAEFDDADDFHSEMAKEKMRAGTPLTDADRWPWLDRLRLRIEEVREQGRSHVLACSALRAAYRDRLRAGDPPRQTRFILLDGERDLILARMSKRRGHYMPTSLLDSQLAILERTPDLIPVSIDRPLEEITSAVRRLLHSDP